MTPDDDNAPAADANQVLPLLGRVDAPGRVMLAPAPAPEGDRAPGAGFPNDPRA